MNFRRVGQSAEYNIKANHDEEAVLRLIMADHDDIRSLAEANREAGGGTQEQMMRLGEMVAAAVQSRKATDAELLRQALTPMAEAVSAWPQSTGWLANFSLLVDHGSAQQFLAPVDEFRHEHPYLELRVNGPLPPYSFVDTPLSQQADGSTTEAFGAAAARPNR